MEEARFLWREDTSSAMIQHYYGVVKFRGEAVELTITASPISISMGLRHGSVGFISTVIYAFSMVLKKEPIMVYMARDRLNCSSDITAHFLIDETMNIEKAKLAILLAEIIAGTEMEIIDFEKMKEEAERFLSEHF
jgi:hypothetical protein